MTNLFPRNCLWKNGALASQSLLLSVTLSRKRWPPKRGGRDDDDDDESDPYKTLGIYGDEETCLSITRAEIKKVFRKLALKLHPDKRPSDERERAAIEFERARKACELLSNAEERQKADEKLRAKRVRKRGVGERKPPEETVEGKTGSERTRGREKQRTTRRRESGRRES